MLPKRTALIGPDMAKTVICNNNRNMIMV